MEKGYWWAGLSHQLYFPYKSFKFPQNSNCHKNSLFNVKSLKLGHFHIFDRPFSFLASVLHHDHFLWLTRSRDAVMQRANLISQTPCFLAPIFFSLGGSKTRDSTIVCLNKVNLFTGLLENFHYIFFYYKSVIHFLGKTQKKPHN